MKRTPFFLLLCGIGFAHAQTRIEYELCGQDFRPIYMHANLPAGAVYANKKASPEARTNDVIKRLTFAEKLMLTGGWNKMHFPAVARLGIPPVYFSDASQGIHIKDYCVKVEQSTSFPSEQALAATWNTGLAYNYAKAISEECQAWGVNVLLGPGLNLNRNDEGGRNFEYPGEDPFLASRIVVNYVKGLQSQGTIATLKHFIGNEQEFARHTGNIKIDERTLNEIYLPPFKAALQEGGALAVMTGNNQVNGYPGAADQPLSEGVLRKKYGYKGIIMSDWANTTFWSDRLDLELTSGHSLLMENNEQFAKYINNEVAAHSAKKAEIEKGLERMIFYNLFTFFKSGVYDRPYRNPDLVKNMEAHKKVALKTAQEAITLLKNGDKLLPLQPAKVNKIVMLGTDDAACMYNGRGSGMVMGYNEVNYLEGLQKVYGDKLIRKANVSDDEVKQADAVLYFIHKPAGEGSDQRFALPDSVNAGISRAAKLNKNIVVIFSGGNGFPMPWLPQVKGLLFNYLLGQQFGKALAGVISGSVNPSGKLPFTIEKSFDDSPAKDYNKMSDGKYYWIGGGGGERKQLAPFMPVNITYNEGIYMGYRWFDKKNIAPQFPFGFGLSYTSFKYGVITLSSLKIKKDQPVYLSFNITNTGLVSGAEVAQLYVRPVNPSADRPVKELKGFQKVFLKAGETKTVKIALKADDLAWWNSKTHAWQIDHGEYEVLVGCSSANVKQKTAINY